MLAQLISNDLFAFFMIFARVGTAIMLLPGFGEAYVARRVRLILALAIAAVLTPTLGDAMPDLPSGAFALFLLLAGEIVIGGFFGTLIKLRKGEPVSDADNEAMIKSLGVVRRYVFTIWVGVFLEGIIGIFNSIIIII